MLYGLLLALSLFIAISSRFFLNYVSIINEIMWNGEMLGKLNCKQKYCFYQFAQTTETKSPQNLCKTGVDLVIASIKAKY